jgi:hypothetical protein
MFANLAGSACKESCVEQWGSLSRVGNGRQLDSVTAVAFPVRVSGERFLNLWHANGRAMIWTETGKRVIC